VTGRPSRVAPWQAHILVSIREVQSDLAAVDGLDGSTHKAAIDEAKSAIDKSLEWATSPKRNALHPVQWFVGGNIDSAYRHLHFAEVLTAGVLPPDEIRARTPDLLSKYRKCLEDRTDDRLLLLEGVADSFHDDPVQKRPGGGKADPATVAPTNGSAESDAAVYRAALRSTYDILDQKHTALRGLRNGLLLGTVILTIIVVALAVVTWLTPSSVPLCFRPTEPNWICPSQSGTGPTSPGSGDIALIEFFGLLGAALSSAIAISRLPRSRETHTISYALALFKLPLGALTAIAGILLTHGRFVPGLTELDTQQQILAYAFVFGFAQIIVTRLIDRQAGDLIGAIPEKEAKPGNGSSTAGRTQAG